MSSTNRPRPGSRGIAGASTRAGVLAILSALILLVGQFVAFADQPDHANGQNQPTEVSENDGNSSSEEVSDTEEGSETEAEAESNVEAEVESETDAEVESDEETESDLEAEGETEAKVEAKVEAENETEAPVQAGGGAKITICHRTNSATNPYVVITVSVSAADGIAGNSGNLADHFGEHPGPLASSLEVAQQLKADHIEWGDIIPDVDDDGNPMPHDGLNWTAQGQAMWANGCAFTSPPTGNLSIVKSGPATATVGGSFSYTVTVTNNGTGPANNVTVTDSVSGALTVTGVTFTSPAGPGTCPTSQNVNCNVGTLQAGQSATVTIAVTAGPNSCPSVQNTAAVSADGIPAESSNTVTTTIPCPPNQPSLSLNKTGTATVTESGAITYTVTVTNSGTAAASNVVITDNLNDSLTNVAASSTIGTCSVGTGNLVTCNVGTLAAAGGAGTSATITIAAHAPNDSCPTITNQATGTHSGGTIPASGTVTTTVTGCAGPTPEASVLIQKTNDANEDGIFSNNEEAKNDGQDVDFTLVITNTSDVAVEITDLTDSFGQATLDLLDDECASLAGMVLDPGESVTCTFTLNNYSPAQGTAIVNVAEVCVEIVGGTVTACDTNPSRVHTAIVLGTTVTPTPTPPTAPPTTTPPGGIAFTGPSSALPLTALALVLLTLGTGLLWAGRRRERPDMS